MKGCLKQCSRAPSPTADHHPPVKHVAFGKDGSEQVFVADEWDRTPAEPARNLSYHDILELKEIQRSLPRAIQPADLIGSRPAAHYLSAVPIGLLPLLPHTDPAPPQPSTAVADALTFAESSWRTVRTPAPSIPLPQPSTYHPPHLAHLPPARPPMHKQKSRFAFLPLLDSQQQLSDQPPSPRSRSCSPTPPAPPPSSERSASPDFFDGPPDPPTPSLTDASLDSSPLSRASSSSPSPEPTFLQLPPSCAHGRFCGGFSKGKRDDYDSSTVIRATSDSHDYDYRRPGFGASRSPLSTAKTRAAQDIPPAPSTPKFTPVDGKNEKKKKNVIVINDIEVELDDDDQGQDEAESNTTPPAKPTSSIPHGPTAIIASPTTTTNIINRNIESPTPTRAFITTTTTSPLPGQGQSASSPTRTSAPSTLFAPMCFKRSQSVQSFACSPPKNSPATTASAGIGGSPVLVPSA